MKTTYIIGEELTPRTFLLSMAAMYGIKEEVQRLLDERPEIEAPINGLGHLLSSVRRESGLSIGEVHARSSISRSQLSFYERGSQKNPGLRTIQALSFGYRTPFALVLMAALWDIRPRAKVRIRKRPHE